jgi:hypothetical protein
MTAQVFTTKVTIETIMRRKAFRDGVAEVRAGRAPRFDGEEFLLMSLAPYPKPITNQQWDYERGRHFGILAPRNMDVMLAGTKRLNPAAVEFFKAQAEIII